MQQIIILNLQFALKMQDVIPNTSGPNLLTLLIPCLYIRSTQLQCPKCKIIVCNNVYDYCENIIFSFSFTLTPFITSLLVVRVYHVALYTYTVYHFTLHCSLMFPTSVSVIFHLDILQETQLFHYNNVATVRVCSLQQRLLLFIFYRLSFKQYTHRLNKKRMQIKYGMTNFYTPPFRVVGLFETKPLTGQNQVTLTLKDSDRKYIPYYKIYEFTYT